MLQRKHLKSLNIQCTINNLDETDFGPAVMLPMSPQSATLGLRVPRSAANFPVVALYKMITYKEVFIRYDTHCCLAEESFASEVVTTLSAVYTTVRVNIFFKNSVAEQWFLTWVSLTAHVIALGWTSVRPSVCPSVCPSHAGIVLKRLNLSSNCLHCLVAP